MRDLRVTNLNLLEQYLKNCEVANKSQHTIKSYRADLEKFIEWLEIRYNSPLNKVNGKIIGEYKDYLTYGGTVERKKPENFIEKFIYVIYRSLFFFIVKDESNKTITRDALSVNSRRRHISSVKNLFEYLKQTNEDSGKVFKSNPVKAKVHSIKLKDKDIQHTATLTFEDFEALNELALKPRDRMIIYILYYGGLRLSEVVGLKVNAIDFQRKTLTFERKGGDIHQLRIYDDFKLFDSISFYIEHRNCESDYLVLSRDNEIMTSRALYGLLKRLFKKAGLRNELSPHSFRKGCATRLYHQTKDILFVRDYLNHKDAKVTQTYIDSHYLLKDGVETKSLL